MRTALKIRLPGIVLLVIAMALLIHTFDPQYAETMAGLNVGPVFFPQLMLYSWIALAVLSVIVIPDALREAIAEQRRHGPAVAMTLALIAFLLLLKPLGFLFDSILLCITIQWISNRRITAMPVVWGTVLAVTSWAMFEFVFGIPLPQPTLF